MKQHETKSKRSIIAEAVGKIGEPVVVDGVAGVASEQEIAAPKGTPKARLIALNRSAKALANTFFQLSTARGNADLTYRESTIAAAQQLRDPNAVLCTDGKLGTIGCHAIHDFYLAVLSKEFMVLRGEGDAAKQSGTVRRYRSDTAAVFSAVQIDKCKMYSFVDRDNKKHLALDKPTVTEKNGIKQVSIIEEGSVVDLLKEQSNVAKVLMVARAIKTGAGYVSNKGNSKRKMMGEKALDNLLESMDGRITPDQALQVHAWIVGEIRQQLPKENRAVFDTTMAEATVTMKQCYMTEKGSKLIDPVVKQGSVRKLPVVVRSGPADRAAAANANIMQKLTAAERKLVIQAVKERNANILKQAA